MKQIERVSIALKPNVYNTFRNLNNTVSNTLGEYVDNAVQSFIDHKKELLETDGSNYKLKVHITIDWTNRSISICDNAAGIDAQNYERAFEPAHIPLDDTGLNEFGMGMKTAFCMAFEQVERSYKRLLERWLKDSQNLIWEKSLQKKERNLL